MSERADEPLFSSLEPIRCEHGRIVAWEVWALPGMRPPEIEHCEQCDPDAVELTDDT